MSITYITSVNGRGTHEIKADNRREAAEKAARWFVSGMLDDLYSMNGTFLEVTVRAKSNATTSTYVVSCQMVVECEVKLKMVVTG